MMEPKRKNSLLILDDVWRGEVVRAFDFGCRVLMTTRDASVAKMVNGRALVIKIQDGFTHAESIKFLADYLGIDQDELPEQANQIYTESKGSPMVLSLLDPLLVQRGNQRQQQVIDTGRWDHYLGKLRDRRYSQLKRNSSYNYETINEAIAISFGDLDDDTRDLLNDFVIFLDDVNIPAPVLQVLWQCSPYEMEEKIGLLVAKSLIAYHVHQGDHTSASPMVVYGIHDLVLDYLKSHVSAEEQLATHRKLIDAYLTECQGDYGALPDDNYIFWFLGYHLYKAECTHLFPQIYLNLRASPAAVSSCT
jgi:apoptotic protease-activating factor